MRQVIPTFDFIEQIRHKFKQQLKNENDLVNLQ